MIAAAWSTRSPRIAARSRVMSITVGTVSQMPRRRACSSGVYSRDPAWKNSSKPGPRGSNGAEMWSTARSASSGLSTWVQPASPEMSMFSAYTLTAPVMGSVGTPSRSVLLSSVIEARCAARPSATNVSFPAIATACSSSARGFSNSPSSNFCVSRRTTDSSRRDSDTRPRRTAVTSSSVHSSPPNWSTPASRRRTMRSWRVFVSRPHALAGIGAPRISMSVSSPKSVQTTPSKPSWVRSRSVTIALLNANPTSSYSVPTGMP